MLLQAAIGDAYGAGFEFAPSELILAENTLQQYRPHLLYTEIHGRYTDDTQMALALAELMLGGEEWSLAKIADAFVKCFHRDPRRGYSSRFYDVLSTCRTGTELRAKLNPDSNRNGAAMRAFPIGLYPDVREVLEKADLQARITHDTAEGRQSAQAVALMAHFNYHGLGAPTEMAGFVEQVIGLGLRTDWQEEVTMYALDAVQAAMTLLARESSLSGLLRGAVAFGGDVDTVGAITLGCASLGGRYVNDLPAWSLRDLENGEYGREYLAGVDEALFLRFPGGR